MAGIIPCFFNVALKRHSSTVVQAFVVPTLNATCAFRMGNPSVFFGASYSLVFPFLAVNDGVVVRSPRKSQRFLPLVGMTMVMVRGDASVLAPVLDVLPERGSFLVSLTWR